MTLLEKRLAIFQPTQLAIKDDSERHRGHKGNADSAAHFELTIASKQFEGLTTLACHRLIYQQVADLIPKPIHALTIKISR